MQALYADAVPMDLFKSEQDRISAEDRRLKMHFEAIEAEFDVIKANLERAIDLARNAATAYSAASPSLRRQWSQLLFTHLYVDDGDVVRAELTPPFAALLADDLVERVNAEMARNSPRRESGAAALSHAKSSNRSYLVEVMRGLSNREHPAAALLSRAESAVAGRRRRRRRAVKLQVQRRLVAGEIEELVRAYEAGATILELRDRFEISRTTVIAHLRRAGVETRYNRLEGRLDEAKRLYEQGWSLARVAAHFDVSAGTVQNSFNRAGVATRPVGTNQWKMHP